MGMAVPPGPVGGGRRVSRRGETVVGPGGLRGPAPAAGPAPSGGRREERALGARPDGILAGPPDGPYLGNDAPVNPRGSEVRPPGPDTGPGDRTGFRPARAVEVCPCDASPRPFDPRRWSCPRHSLPRPPWRPRPSARPRPRPKRAVPWRRSVSRRPWTRRSSTAGSTTRRGRRPRWRRASSRSSRTPARRRRSGRRSGWSSTRGRCTSACGCTTGRPTRSGPGSRAGTTRTPSRTGPTS